MTTFSNSLSMMLAKTYPTDEPIDTPSTCSYKLLYKEKAVLVQESMRSLSL